ncbi:hypothetical protein HMPREF9711_01167 [Myroides odoratimimus CCUG 3837]|nr:hypothetical protein HMPREF9711_01167 [Myroides odoratimimus CCUG 3837]
MIYWVSDVSNTSLRLRGIRYGYTLCETQDIAPLPYIDCGY